MQAYLAFLTRAQDIYRYIDYVYIRHSWNKVPTCFHLHFDYCNDYIFELNIKNKKDDLILFYFVQLVSYFFVNEFVKRNNKSN